MKKRTLDALTVIRNLASDYMTSHDFGEEERMALCEVDDLIDAEATTALNTKPKGQTVTYMVTLAERDSASFLTALDNASEEGQIAEPFNVQLMEDRAALTALQRGTMIRTILRSDLNDINEDELNGMDDYELRLRWVCQSHTTIVRLHRWRY